MTNRDGFDRTVSDWLDEQAGRGAPGYLDEVLSRTTRTRQRPAWSSLERWLPVQTTLRLTPVPRVAWLLVVLGLILAVGVAALAIGSRPRLPAPFGPARNGAIVTSSNGDIWSIDASNGARKPMIADPIFDFGVTFSRDGTKFLFYRAPDPNDLDAGLELAVAKANGTDVRVLTPALRDLAVTEWSADGTQIAILSHPEKDGAGVISVVNVDGSGIRTLDVGRPAFLVSWLPPDGREIVFRGEQLRPDDPFPGIFAVRPDGTGLRMISTTPALDKFDYQGVGVSPDGRRVTYATAEGPILHILDLQTGADRELPSPPGITAQTDAVFSPDGRSVVYQRWYWVNRTQLVVAPADGSDTGIPIGTPSPVGRDGPDLNNYYFTPDGSAVIVNDGTEVTRRLPVDGSAGTVVSTGSMTFAAMQRLAP